MTFSSRTNHSFFLKCSPNRTEASETVLDSSSTDLQVTRSKRTFRHRNSKWAKILIRNEPKYYFEMSQNIGASDPMMNELIQCFIYSNSHMQYFYFTVSISYYVLYSKLNVSNMSLNIILWDLIAILKATIAKIYVKTVNLMWTNKCIP